jgi:YidC/Oxa1 family membrane protein insertase
MDKKQLIRILLYAALMFSGMMLWEKWQGQKASHEKKSATEHHQNINANSASKTAKAHQVSLSNDVVTVTLNRQGGSVVNVTLHDYFETMKKQSPVQVMNESDDNYLIGSSGVVGDDKVLFHVKKKSHNDHASWISMAGTLKSGVVIEKVYTLEQGKYAVDVKTKVYNQSEQSIRVQGQDYIKQVEPEKKDAGWFAFQSFQGMAYHSDEHSYKKISFSDMDDSDLKQTANGGWIASQTRYFLSAWVPKSHVRQHIYTRTIDGGYYIMGLVNPVVEVLPNEMVEITSTLYAGPEIIDNLKPISSSLALTVDFGFLWVLSQGIFWVMEFIEQYIGNWGWSIVLVTLLIKALFYGLSAKSYRSMARMRDLQPKIKALQEQYKDDKQRLGQETVALYKKEKINPLSGCLPMLIQIPFFLALYWVLMESVQLRHAPFILWIHDLASKDPYYVLPVLMGITMFLQQKMNPTQGNPDQEKVMMVLPLIFTVMFLNFPSGLVLYWLVNNVLSIAQQWSIMRMHGKS